MPTIMYRTDLPTLRSYSFTYSLGIFTILVPQKHSLIVSGTNYSRSFSVSRDE